MCKSEVQSSGYWSSNLSFLRKKYSLTDYTDYTDIVFGTRILGLDFRNKDFRILGFRGLSFRNEDFRILGLRGFLI